jgi:hypothetical protein
MNPIFNSGASAPSLEELRGKGVVNDIVQKWSNLGSGNIFKGPTARTLFYEAGKRKPGKYGQFLFYSLGNHENNFIDAYYRSENRQYNRSISSKKSKNPSAGFLVRETSALEAVSVNCNSIFSGFTTNFEKNIVGGMAAPYYWKDFLFCKYYATIPNNYMLTLRRFPTPVLDNLSVPAALKSSSAYNAEGVGRPVAQAVTWFGGNTGNKLNDIIQFSTGIKWKSKEQSAEVIQQAMSQGFLDDTSRIFGDIFGGLGDGAEIRNTKALLNAAVIASDPNNTSVANTKFMKFRDLMKNGEKNAGLLSEYIWTSVDVVNKTNIRDIGLPFTWGAGDGITVTFEYDLTSVGEVNTKASMLDIIGNLLSIGTNYGSFLTPDFRYNSNFPAFGFPGGSRGLEMFYRDPIQFVLDYAEELVNPASSAKTSADINKGSFGDNNDISKLKNALETVTKNNGNPAAAIEAIKKEFGGAAGRLLQTTFTPGFFEQYQFPASLLTGAPIGEWHLVVGNPCNPIAMIGNLICEKVKIDFGEALGPDDFPTSVKAVFSLKHGRDRERGEIESIFNRGDGRLYQSSMPTTANAQSYDAISTVDGRTLKNAVSDIFDQRAYGGFSSDQTSPGR